MNEDTLIWIAIAVMAAVTWFTRIGGYWLMRLVPQSGAVKRGLDTLPGALVVAILAPMALNGGWAAPTAILAAIVIGRAGLSAIFAVFGAVGVVALLRLSV